MLTTIVQHQALMLSFIFILMGMLVLVYDSTIEYRSMGIAEYTQ